MLLTPPALALIAWAAVTGEGHFVTGTPGDTWLLLGAGVVTAVPLIVCATGAKLLRLSTIGVEPRLHLLGHRHERIGRATS
jgi:chloramphenicol-sensitive protein RarD